MGGFSVVHVVFSVIRVVFSVVRVVFGEFNDTYSAYPLSLARTYLKGPAFIGEKTIIWKL